MIFKAFPTPRILFEDSVLHLMCEVIMTSSSCGCGASGLSPLPPFHMFAPQCADLHFNSKCKRAEPGQVDSRQVRHQLKTHL